MRLLFLAAFIAVSGAAKLNNGYLPPPSAKSAGGHPEDLDVPLETPLLRSNQGNQPNRGGQPAGSYTNNFQGVVVDAAAAGTRTADTGLGLPRPAYGSEISKVGDAAFKTNEGAFNTAPQSFNQPGEVQSIANPGIANDGPDRNANIVKYEAAVGSEDFNFAFETDNGIMAEENGVATNGVQAQGAFSYKSDDGQTYSVSYTADENGYQPKGDHLPTPPPIPEEILKSLEQNARDEAAGIVDDGTYDANKYNAPREHNESDNGQYKAKQSNTGSRNGELNASGSLSGEESRPFAQLQHGTEQQTEHSAGNNNQFAQRGQQNNFGRLSASAAASNEYLPPQESRPQNAYRKPERIQSPEVNSYNNQQVNSQNSGRYQQAPQPQRPYNSASASASFGSDHSPAQQVNQAPSTAAPNFQRPQSLSQQPLGNSFQHSSAQYNQQYNQQPTQEEPCCQDNSGPQPHNSASASASFHNSYNSRPNSASGQSSVSSQRNQHFQSHQNNPSTAAPNFQKPQGFTQQPLENMLFNSNRPESQQYTQQSSEEPHQDNFPPQSPASASSSFNNQVYSQRPNSASASASFSSQPRQQFQSQSNGQDHQFRPNQQKPQANQQYVQNTENQGEVNNFEQQQQQDDSYYYNQPAKSFPTPTNSPRTTHPTFDQELGHTAGSKVSNYNQKSVAQKGSSRFPSPPTLAPTFAPEPPTLPPRETEHNEQHSQYQETQSFSSPQPSHPQQTTAVPKPFPQRQNFGQKANNYQQSQASVLGQGTYNHQPQAHESFPNQPSQQYDGEVYEYNKPEQTLTPGKDSSSQATEQTDVQSEENIDQSVDVQEPLAVQPTGQASAEASYHGQGSSQASAQFRAPMPHGSPVAGKGEVFGGPRQPPSFNEQTGYHY